MGDVEDARNLIANGADVSAVGDSSSKQTLTHLAVRFGHANLVALLVEAGADLTARDSGGRTPLHTAARGFYEEEVMLEDFKQCEEKADVSAEDRLTICRLLLDAGAEVGASASLEEPWIGGNSGQHGWTPLYIAAYNKHHALAVLLLERGADVNAKNGFDEETPLHSAVHCNCEKMARILVDHGANLDAMGRMGHDTPLHLTIFRDCVKMLKLLVHLGANVNAAHNGITVLDLAVTRNDKLVRALLEGGADVTARNSEDRTPLLVAAGKRRGLAGQPRPPHSGWPTMLKLTCRVCDTNPSPLELDSLAEGSKFETRGVPPAEKGRCPPMLGVLKTSRIK